MEPENGSISALSGWSLSSVHDESKTVDYLAETEEDEANYDHAQNPLFLSETLSRICVHLPTDVLKTCRFVSKLWNDEASRVLGSRCIITFRDGLDIVAFAQDILLDSNNSTQDSIQLRMFRKFRILETPVENINPSTASTTDSPSIGFNNFFSGKWLKICGPSMTALTFEMVDVSPTTGSLFPAFQNILYESCPNLRHFELLGIRYNPVLPVDGVLVEPRKLKIKSLKIPIYLINSYEFIQSLLTSSPELESLSIQVLEGLEPPAQLFELLSTLKNYGHLRNLHSFSLEGRKTEAFYLGSESAWAFYKININWEHLTLRVLNPGILFRILKDHGRLLKSLSIVIICSRRWMKTFHEEQLPMMEDLKKLRIVANRLYFVKFLMRTPNLVECSLTVDQKRLSWVGIEERDEFQGFRGPVLDLKDIRWNGMRRLDVSEYPLSKTDCKIMVQIFPNLKAISVTEEKKGSTFRNVCDYFGPQLEELRLFVDRNMGDQALIRNIQSLTALKQLHIQGPRVEHYWDLQWGFQSKLTNKTFIRGILELEQLSHLYVDLERIDEVALNAIEVELLPYLQKLVIVDSNMEQRIFQDLKGRFPSLELIREHPHFEHELRTQKNELMRIV